MPLQINVADIAGLLGQEVGVSSWQTLDQQRIDAFADITGDHQYIHVDQQRAAQTPFGGTIAHGFLTLSMLAVFAEQASPQLANTVMGVNYGFDKLRFLSPVRSGKRVRGRFILMDYQEKSPGQHLIKYQVTVEIEGEQRPALAAEWLTMVVTA